MTPELDYGLIISLFDVDKPPGGYIGSHEGSQQRLLLHIFLGNHRPLIIPVVSRGRLSSSLCLTGLLNVELKVLGQRVDLTQNLVLTNIQVWGNCGSLMTDGLNAYLQRWSGNCSNLTSHSFT